MEIETNLDKCREKCAMLCILLNTTVMGTRNKLQFKAYVGLFGVIACISAKVGAKLKLKKLL